MIHKQAKVAEANETISKPSVSEQDCIKTMQNSTTLSEINKQLRQGVSNATNSTSSQPLNHFQEISTQYRWIP